MDVRFSLYIFILILLITGSSSLAESASGNESLNTLTNTTLNLTVPDLTPDEKLLILAQEAQRYALDNGKLAALSAFSDKSSFVRDGMYIAAYDWRGVLLADPYQGDRIGTLSIADDHDNGIVRHLRDLAQSGGGILTAGASGDGITYYASRVDGSWWIAAASGRPAV